MSGRERLEGSREHLVETLLGDMERDGPDWTKSWEFEGLPHNPVTGTVYRGRNALLLYLAMRDRGIADPRSMTFKQAVRSEYRVRKGCHGFPIEHWSRGWMRLDPETGRRERVSAPRTPEESAAYADDPNIMVSAFLDGAYTVFSAADIEGIEPFERPTCAFESVGVADFLEANTPCHVREEFGDRACYLRSMDLIVVPLREQFGREGAFARTLLHEQAHATGSESRLARQKGSRFGDERYAFEELVAELSSMMSANELGIALASPEAGSVLEAGDYWQSHVAYIRSWASMAGAEEAADLVLQAATKAGQATDWLMGSCWERALARGAVVGRDAAEREVEAETFGCRERGLPGVREVGMTR